MFKNEEKVSVCIATFNGEKYIRQQLESILFQLLPNDEIVISDNCSSDGTIDIITSFADSRISIHSFEVKSVTLNFENAIKYACGDIIILSDQDDVWLNGKVSRIRQELKIFDLVVTDCIIVDEHLNLLKTSLFDLIQSNSGIIRNLVRNSYTGCCMAFNRKIVHAALPFPKNLPMHDWWIGLVAEIAGSVTFVKRPYLLHRRHGSNASTLSVSSKLGMYKKIYIRVMMLRNLTSRFVFKG